LALFFLMLKKIQKALSNYEVILEPDQNKKDWWAGAPSVVRTKEGTFYMAARMREADSPRGRRGYENRILKSDDGIHFKTINKIHRDDAGVPVFERPSLVQDPLTKKFRLYGCSSFSDGWGIWKLDDVVDPANFDPKTLKPLLQADAEKKEKPSGTTDIDASHHQYVRINGYKDPFVFWNQMLGSSKGKWHMFVIGYDKVERPYHFIAEDDEGVNWRAVSKDPILESTGWHNFFTRPSCILPLSVGYLFVYEGSNIHDFDPTYNIATGLAYTPDLANFIDLTPKEPLLKSTTPCKYHSWRYSHWLKVEDEIFVYFEACRENQSNEIRLARFPAILNK